MCVILLLFLYLCSTVEGHPSYMQVCVNRVQLPHVTIIEKQHKSETYTYYYVNGDTADIWCLRMQANCTLQLNYEFYDDSIGGNGHIIEKLSSTDSLLGLRTTLGAKHNGKSIVCECSDDSGYYKITVVLRQASPNGLLVLKAFNTTILYDRLEASTSLAKNHEHSSHYSIYNVNYAYKRNENIMLSCDTTERNVTPQICRFYKNCIQDTKINVRPDDDDDGKMVRCEAHKNGAVIRSVNVYFTKFLSTFLYDEVPLNFNVENSLLELYEHKGDRRIYFDYNDGATPKFTCETSNNVMHFHNNAWLVLNDKVSRPGETYVEKQVRLRSEHNRTTMNCDLYAIHCCSIRFDANNHTLRHAEVLFRLKPRNSIPDPIGPIVSISEGVSIQVEYGERKTLTCKVTSYPAPIITWTNSHGEPLTTQTNAVKLIEDEYVSYLTIQYASKSDNYSCYATNDRNNQVKSIYVHVKSPFVIESTLPEETWLQYGASATLTCDIRSTKPYHIYWYHKEKERNTNLTETSNKYEISSDGKVLTINVMNLDVQGKYTCEACLDKEDEFVTQDTEVRIKGITPPRATGDDIKTVPVGSGITIQCSVTGIPPPKISWQFMGKHDTNFVFIAGSNNELNIPRVEEKDAGIYKCSAQNDLGISEHNTSLIVQVPPKVYGDTAKIRSVGLNTTIECRVFGTPQPTISWQFMGKHDTNFVFIAGSNNVLNIPRVKEKDAGIYKCVARNDIGISDHNTSLIVQVPPKVTGEDTKTAIAGSNVTVECIVTGTQPKITWQFMPKGSTTFVSKPAYDSMIHIVNVEEQHAGLYKCVVWNDLNIVEHNTRLIVAEIEDKNLKWIIAAASGVVILIVAIVATVCIAKRSKLPTHTSTPVDDAPIPLYPSQWDRHDVVPADQILEDPTYSEALAQRTETDMTAGSTSHKNGTANDLTYAELDIASLNRVRNGQAPKRFIFNDCAYAEVKPGYFSPDYVCLREN